MSARRCSACGAMVALPPGTRSTTCAFCDSALVDDDTVSDDPVDRVVPFVVPRPRAAALLGAWLSGHWFAPESVRRASRPDELRDVLVPFWVYDAIARTTFHAQVGIHWYRTETYTVIVNGKAQTRTRQVRETDWHPLSGSHVRQWTGHLVSASRGLAESEANTLEPFDLGRSRPYAPALVAGVTAEVPTVPRSEAAPLAERELAQRERQVVEREHLPGDTARGLTTDTVSTLEAPRLYLLPVWVAAVKGPKGPVRLLVNGQTGEVVGQVPRSGLKVALAVAVAVAVVLGLFGILLFGGTVLAAVGAILGAVR